MLLLPPRPLNTTPPNPELVVVCRENGGGRTRHTRPQKTEKIKSPRAAQPWAHSTTEAFLNAGPIWDRGSLEPTAGTTGRLTRARSAAVHRKNTRSTTLDTQAEPPAQRTSGARRSTLTVTHSPQPFRRDRPQTQLNASCEHRLSKPRSNTIAPGAAENHPQRWPRAR